MAALAILHGSNDLYGASRVLADDVEILSQRGHEVVVLLPEDGPLTALLEERGAKVTIEPLRVIRKVDGITSLRPPMRLPAAVRLADVVVTWTLALSSYLPVLRAHRKRVISSVHEILPGRAGHLLSRGTGELAHVLMTNSETTSQWLQTNGVEGRKLHLAYPQAPPYDPLAPPANAYPQFTALLAGRVNGHKGHVEAVQAAKLVRASGVDLRLILLGGAFPGQERHLEEVRAAAKAVPGVEFLGEVPDIRPFLADSNVMLVPTTRPEPFGVVALEGWAAGRRIIASNEGGLAEATRMVDGISVPAGDVGALAEAMTRVARSDALRAAPSPQAEVASRCTREARESAWDDVLAAILPGARK